MARALLLHRQEVCCAISNTAAKLWAFYIKAKLATYLKNKIIII